MRSVVFLLLGAALLAGLFVVLRPQGAPPLPFRVPGLDPAPGVATPSNPPAPAGDVTTPAAVVSEVPSGPRTFGEPASRTFDLEIRGGRVTSEASTFTVAQGDLVVLRVISDRADELHLHGYDVAVKLTANQPASLAFQADRSGRFDVELHHGGEEIAAIEVQPR